MDDPQDCPNCGLPIDLEILEELGGDCAYCGKKINMAGLGDSEDI